MALTTLCDRLGAESAMLLEKTAQEYRCTAAAPESTPSDDSLPADGFLLRRLKAYPFPLPITQRRHRRLDPSGQKNTHRATWRSCKRSVEPARASRCRCEPGPKCWA